ncbi:unnamed protein product [Caenorhabditis sp. 36 PRJEB53466]|nr:unnamed protein product [Caenorhabditis sp. 36 PRJEB53466]
MDAKTFLLHNIIETVGRRSLASVEFKCGDCVGPYALSNNDGGVRVTLSNFTGEPVTLEFEANSVVSRIQFTPSPLFANSVVLQTSAFVQILFTKDVLKNEPLRAILVADMNYQLENEKGEKGKKFECSKCHMAKFNSMQNLKIHEEQYCAHKEKAPEPQNLILLPLAFHDMPQQNAVVGPVHSLVPVAVGRQTTLVNTNPVFVHNNSNLEIPSSLSVSHPTLSIKIPVIDLDEKVASTPLDLSSSSRAASIPSLSASCSPTSKSSSSEPFSPEKPFSCSCGVSFSSQNTFDAHKQFYCQHTQPALSAGASRTDASRKVPEKCGKCDFVPVSTSQLAMHTRTAHQTTKTFTCLVCGYRAFSMRGVRTHMRSHPSEDAQRFKVNEPDA